MPAMIWREFMNKARRDKTVFKRRPDRVAQFDKHNNPARKKKESDNLFTSLMQKNLELVAEQSQVTLSSFHETKKIAVTVGKAKKVNWDELIIND